jgi:hypothetical protein
MLLGLFILPIELVIVKNINGTIDTNKRFKKISPNGLSISVFSLNTKPTIAPIIIDASRIIVPL